MFKLLPKGPAYVKAVKQTKNMPDHDSCIHNMFLLQHWSKMPEKKNNIKASLTVLCIMTSFRGKRNDFYAYYNGEKKCPSFLASTETVRDFLLPAENIVHDKWLIAETLRVRQEAESRGPSRQEAIFCGE